MSKKRKSYIGRIYTIEPEHIIKKRDLANYKTSKQSAANNKRPVLVSVQRTGKRVQVSSMTSKAQPTDIAKGYRTKLEKTYPGRESYVKTESIGKSRKTGMNFMIDKDPLTRSNLKIQAKQEDVGKHQRARSKMLKKRKHKKK